MTTLALSLLLAAAPAVPPTGQPVDPAHLDTSVPACQDFFTHAVGGWQKANPIPADKARYGAFEELLERNRAILKVILEETSARKDWKRGSIQQKVGDFYASGMDEVAIEKAGTKPLAPWLARIDALKGAADLPGYLAAAQLRDLPGGIGFRIDQDEKDSTRYVPILWQAGLGLPDRDYYLKDDSRSKDIRAGYLAHVARVLQLLGDSPEQSKAGAETVMRIESELATGHMSRVERRNPDNVYHRMPRAKLTELAPSWPWDSYIQEMGLAQIKDLNVTSPGFFPVLEKQLKSVPLDDWKTYLRWHVARLASPYLGSAFVNADFDFFSKTLSGQQQLQPRWKRCVNRVDRHLGEALGQVYVEKYFTPDTRARTLRMVEQIERAMEEDINSLDWMSADTKKQALEKLHGVTNKIGHPDRWRDYSPVRIARDDFYGSALSAMGFEVRRQRDKIGKPLVRGEWYMSPPTVNANYDPQMNDINFPAGVLQPPAFDPKMDDAPNYGNTGGTIGHELTHGFDDEGRRFDAKGNLRDWWTEADNKEFERRASCISAQYSSYIQVDDVHVNGKLTVGEDVADLGGLILAYRAWLAETANQKLGPKDALTPAQRFFVGYGQSWCANTRPETLRQRAITDPHSPERYRTNGVLSNLPEFREAYGCKSGQPMVKEPICKVW